MPTHTFHAEQLVHRPISEVFAFFQDHTNLARLTPPALAFKILPTESKVVGKGAEFRYSMKLLGIPLVWTARITRYEPPYLFEDVQLKGPYAYWKHTHSFEERGSSTLIKDHIEYRLPFGLLGSLAGKGFAQHNLTQAFAYRKLKLSQIFP